MIAMVAIGIEHPGGPVKATTETNLVTGFTSALNIILSYGELSIQVFVYTHSNAVQQATTPSSMSSPN